MHCNWRPPAAWRQSFYTRPMVMHQPANSMIPQRPRLHSTPTYQTWEQNWSMRVSTFSLHGLCMLRECIHGECAHEQHPNPNPNPNSHDHCLLSKWKCRVCAYSSVQLDKSRVEKEFTQCEIEQLMTQQLLRARFRGRQWDNGLRKLVGRNTPRLVRT